MNLARFCVENTGNLLSYSRIADILQVNKKMLIDYFSCFENAFFIFQNRFFSWKVKETIAANKPKKIYLIDHFYKSHMGLRSDIGRVVENIVYLEMKRHYKEVFYWQGKNGVDFIVRSNKVMAFQVSYSNDIAEREAAALIDCSKELKVEGTFIITEDLYKKERVHGVDICFMPLWLFLLADKGLIEEGKI
jgi:predicted AAA+ superfamily ATPase